MHEQGTLRSNINVFASPPTASRAFLKSCTKYLHLLIAFFFRSITSYGAPQSKVNLIVEPAEVARYLCAILSNSQVIVRTNFLTVFHSLLVRCLMLSTLESRRELFATRGNSTAGYVTQSVNSPHSLREASLNTYLQFRSTKHLKTTREGLSVENMF